MYLILISSLNCFLDCISPSVIKYVSTYFFNRKKHDEELKNHLRDHKRMMASLNMADQFSQYAKIQRKCIKLEETLKQNANQRMAYKVMVELIATYAFRMINGLLCLSQLYWYKQSPVIILPEGTFWPFEKIMSWPNYYEDSISFVVWFIIAQLALRNYKNINTS